MIAVPSDCRKTRPGQAAARSIVSELEKEGPVEVGLRPDGAVALELAEAPLAAGHAVLQAQGKVVGVPTACVLWASTGDPRKYHAAAAYRKAMGLNLVERSSGQY